MHKQRLRPAETLSTVSKFMIVIMIVPKHCMVNVSIFNIDVNKVQL